MLIDWFTVVAQVLNFIVLVWLMKRFLYGPVLDAIAAREKRIADQITAAETKEAQAIAERDSFEKRNVAFDAQRGELLAQATAQAQSEGQRLLEQARRAADQQALERQRSLRTEAQHLAQAIGGRAREEVFAIARKTLADLSTSTLEANISEVFVERLGELKDPAKARLSAALKAATESPRLRSAFELQAGSREAIESAINQTFSTAVTPCYEVEPDLVCGIELSVGGEKLSWTIAEYLTSLEKGVAEVMATSGTVAAPLTTDPAPRNEGEPSPSPPSSGT